MSKRALDRKTLSRCPYAALVRLARHPRVSLPSASCDCESCKAELIERLSRHPDIALG